MYFKNYDKIFLIADQTGHDHESSLSGAGRELATLMGMNQRYTSLAPSRHVNPPRASYPTDQSSEAQSAQSPQSPQLPQAPQSPQSQNISHIPTINQDEEIEDENNEVIGGKPKRVWDNIRRTFYDK